VGITGGISERSAGRGVALDMAVDAFAAASFETASHAFDQAQFAKDVSALDQQIAPDMCYINGGGQRLGKSEFIAFFTNAQLSFEPFVITGREVVALSDTICAVTGNGMMRGMLDGVRFEDCFRYTDIFARRDGSWQVVYVQVTPQRANL
jgi:Domain of unknown function (DUF4440)